MDNMKIILKKDRIIIIAGLIFLLMSLTNRYFFTAVNLNGLFESMTAYGIVAIGLTFVMIAGQLDISMGSVMALTSCIFMILLPHAGFILSMLTSLLLGCVLGAITGSFVALFRLSPFIVSLSMMTVYKGVALVVTKSTPVSNMHPTLLLISNIKIGPIPVTFLFFILVALIAQFFLSRTQFGRKLYIIGGNITVADNLGLNVNGHIWAVFIIQGFLAALGGVVLMTRMFSASGNLAMDAPLSIIPMVIVGGTAFSGGKGGAIKTIYGVVLLYIIYNAMSMFNIYVNIQQLIKGIILLIIIVSDKYMQNHHQKA